MDGSLPRRAPATQGVASSGISRFLDALEHTDGIEPHSLMVIRHGAVIAEGWWAPFVAERVHLLYSLSKSFTATAIALALDDGLVNLDDTVLTYYPELDGEITDERTRLMRVRHLLAMSSGHLEDTWNHGPSADWVDPVRTFLHLAPEREPGTVFAYNQSATYTLAAIVQRVTGQSVNDYLHTRLIGPIGALDTSWYEQPAGQNIGYSGLHATTETIARLGLLYLQGGVWDGVPLLPSGWTDEAMTVHIANSPRAAAGEIPEPDWGQGYGFQFWRSRHGWRGDGAYGQYCLILAEQDAVVAMTGQSLDMQAVLDAVWTELLPAFDGASGGGPGSSDGADTDDAVLAERLAGLALPVRSAAPAPADPSAWRDAAFAADTDADTGAEGAASKPANAEVSAVRVVEHSGRWELIVEQGDDRLHVPLGRTWEAGRWDQGGAPVVASGGWLDESTVVAEIVLLESPHRLVVTVDRSSGTARARWATVPLFHRPLRLMGSPASTGAAQESRGGLRGAPLGDRNSTR
jgi:CubicO group peptidase (beta-lactamase class C family)